MEFEWDPEKAAENLAKHGVDFSEASTIRAWARGTQAHLGSLWHYAFSELPATSSVRCLFEGADTADVACRAPLSLNVLARASR